MKYWAGFNEAGPRFEEQILMHILNNFQANIFQYIYYSLYEGILKNVLHIYRISHFPNTLHQKR